MIGLTRPHEEEGRVFQAAGTRCTRAWRQHDQHEIQEFIFYLFQDAEFFPTNIFLRQVTGYQCLPTGCSPDIADIRHWRKGVSSLEEDPPPSLEHSTQDPNGGNTQGREPGWSATLPNLGQSWFAGMSATLTAELLARAGAVL
jgi:hypothetical protein